MKQQHPAIEGILKSWHPKMVDEAEQSFVLKPDIDAYLQEKVEKAGFNYDELKRDFLLSHQIISEKSPEETKKLLDKNAVPLNALNRFFEGYISGIIKYAQRERVT